MTDRLQKLTSKPVTDPQQPVRRGEKLKYCKNIQLEELIPTPTKLDGVVEVAILGNDTEVQPASAIHCLFARIVVDIPAADFDTHFLAFGSLFFVIPKVDVTDLSSVYTTLFHDVPLFSTALLQLLLPLRLPDLGARIVKTPIPP